MILNKIFFHSLIVLILTATVKAEVIIDESVYTNVKYINDKIPTFKQPSYSVTVNEKQTKLSIEKGYVKVGKVKKGDVVTMKMPIPTRKEKAAMDGITYNMTIKGNTVIDIDPEGEVGPLYQRDYYRSNETQWKNKARFVPAMEIDW